MNAFLKNKQLFLVLLIAIFFGCKTEKVKTYSGAELQNFCVQQLTDVIVYDINNPPVAGRMYAYSNLAFYEALRPMNSGYESLLPKLKGFSSINQADTSLKIDYPFSAGIAFMKVAEALVFSKDSIQKTRALLVKNFAHLETAIQTASIDWEKRLLLLFWNVHQKMGIKLQEACLNLVF